MQTRPSIRSLLLGAHAFALFFPLLALALLRVYDVYLLRQTEHRLIAESVVVGEAYRAAYLTALGRTDDEHRAPATPSDYPSWNAPRDEPYQPIGAQIDFFQPVLPAQQTQFPRATSMDAPSDAPSARAGGAIAQLVARAQTFNLSAVRVLDARGCVVATTGTEAGACMSDLPEVAHALAGRYKAVLRERISDEPPPALESIRRRGKVRVFTALPIWSDGKVIGVVRASRTGLDALSSLWANRRGLIWLSLLVMAMVFAVSLTFSAAIARPLGRLTQAARAVSAGERPARLALGRTVPREIGVLHDVLFEMADRLSRRASYVQEFASQVSHELKTPITAIRGAAELLSLGLDDMPREDRRRFLDNVLEDAQRMERLVSRLLELARLENRGRQPAPPTIDVGASIRRLLARHGERVIVSLPPEPVRAAIEPELLASVVSNLVENGLRHGEGKPVEVQVDTTSAQVRITVIDRGPGVSEANQKRLFERFFTTERDQGGTGLGLAIVKAIAEARGGSASAAFDQRGSVFTVVL